MSDTAIKVEDVSKLYMLGRLGTGTIAKDFERWFARIRGKEDPLFKLGQVNNRAVKSATNAVWALKDVSFEVKKGDILGIIGRNGAGKSTMLKILCKITAPSKGRIYIDGRIGSLLEVGTGFHPEMTGRENIFMNGAILGMEKALIRARFDEIVDFAGVEAYIDTPVKHYSSGMYTRLAFSSAAFLEPEILILDEVLAVGDMEFSQKCMNRMREVNLKEGRTVILVSHNLTSVKNLTRKCLLFEKGQLMAQGDPEEIAATYEEAMQRLIN